MSKELVGVMLGAAFTIAMTTTPNVDKSWAVAVAAWVATAVLVLWWWRIHSTDVATHRMLDRVVAAHLDGLTVEENQALQRFVCGGGVVEREVLESVRKKTPLISRDYTGDFHLVDRYANILTERLLRR